MGIPQQALLKAYEEAAAEEEEARARGEHKSASCEGKTATESAKGCPIMEHPFFYCCL